MSNCEKYTNLSNFNWKDNLGIGLQIKQNYLKISNKFKEQQKEASDDLVLIQEDLYSALKGKYLSFFHFTFWGNSYLI